MTNIKQEAGEGGAQQEGQQHEHPLQRRRAAGGAAVEPEGHRAQEGWQAAAFQGMEQARVLGETLQQVQMQLVACQARASAADVEHKAQFSVMEAHLNARISILEAANGRLQLELARRDAEPSQMELHFNRQREQIASMQQQLQQQQQQLLDQMALFVARPAAARAADGVAPAPAPALAPASLLSQQQQVFASSAPPSPPFPHPTTMSLTHPFLPSGAGVC